MEMNNLKVMHWNFFSEHDSQSGIKRYEDELFNSIKELVNTKRIQRTRRSYLMDAFKFKREDADVVHATFQMLAPLKVINRVNKFVLTVHDLIPMLYFSRFQKFRNLWFLSECTIQYANKIIVDSQFTKRELIRYLKCDNDKIRVVPLGVDEKYQPLDKSACRKKIGLHCTKKYILIVSSNLQWKNMELINKIVTEFKDYRFIKIGYGETLHDSNVLSLGYVNEHDMAYIYNACDLFLHPSFYEGFGLPPLEAMACGIPVISSNATSLPEVVEGAGILVNPSDVAEWKDAIHRIMTDEGLKEELTKKGLCQSKKFTWEKTAEGTVKVYKDVIK